VTRDGGDERWTDALRHRTTFGGEDSGAATSQPCLERHHAGIVHRGDVGCEIAESSPVVAMTVIGTSCSASLIIGP